jgi:hypothetical protein
MSNEFKIKILLPSGKYIRLAELKNKDYQVILKYCENSDPEGLNDLFDSLVFSDYKSLDIIDKFYTLLTLRMMFIDPDLVFTDENNAAVKFSIGNILEKIDHFENDFSKTVSKQEFTLELGLPNIIFFKSVNDIYSSTIRTIKLKDRLVDFTELSDLEKENILANIPNTLFSCINNYITQLSNQLQDFVIIEQNQQFNIKEVNTNIISNEFMSFILAIFSTGLQNFFETMYVFSNKLNITGSTFYDLSPLDTRVLINIYNKDINEQNKELQKQNKM